MVTNRFRLGATRKEPFFSTGRLGPKGRKYLTQKSEPVTAIPLAWIFPRVGVAAHARGADLAPHSSTTEGRPNEKAEAIPGSVVVAVCSSSVARQPRPTPVPLKLPSAKEHSTASHFQLKPLPDLQQHI